MTTDSQTDLSCQIAQQASLNQIAVAWNVLCSEKDHYETCVNQFSEKKSMCLSASGHVSEKELQIPSFDSIAEHLKSQKFANNLSDEEKFNVLTQDLYLSLTDFVNHDLKAKKGLEELIKNQESELKSAYNKLSSTEIRITQSEKELRELDTSIGIESLLLFGALVVGAIGGAWGAIIAVIAMFWWRSNAY
jgi:hypothetical protein